MLIIILGFFLFFRVLLVSQFSTKTLFIGLMLLLFCILVFLVFCSLNMTWYGLLFFLVYVGGLLVLFFYVLSIKSNPLALEVGGLFGWYFSFLFILFFLFLFLGFYFSLDYAFRSSVEDVSYFLFNRKERFLMVFVGFFLLFVLFVVKKLTFDVKGAIRPIKF